MEPEAPAGTGAVTHAVGAPKGVESKALRAGKHRRPESVAAPTRPARPPPWLGRYRVFVEDGRIIGVSSYYPQRRLPDTPEVREDIAACLAEADKLIAALPTPLRHPGGPHTGRSPESKSFTADFMRLEDGRFLYLEGGPPFSPASGAHPCCFEHFDNWHDGAAFHLSGVPVALSATSPEESR